MLKPLKPSMREKKRYLYLNGNFTRKQVEESILKYIGILGYAKACPQWISNNILAINRSEIDKIRASFALTNNIQVMRVSGTLKSLKSKI